MMTWMQMKLTLVTMVDTGKIMMHATDNHHLGRFPLVWAGNWYIQWLLPFLVRCQMKHFDAPS